MTGILRRLTQWKRDRQAARITLAGACRRAARGAAYLDAVNPGWYRQVDPETLELAHGASCVLGQLHGDFRLGLSRAALLNMGSAPRASLSPVTWGFQCVQHVGEDLQDLDYAYLDQAWRAEVVRRQQHDRQSVARLFESVEGDPAALLIHADAL